MDLERDYASVCKRYAKLYVVPEFSKVITLDQISILNQRNTDIQFGVLTPELEHHVPMIFHVVLIFLTFKRPTYAFPKACLHCSCVFVATSFAASCLLGDQRRGIAYQRTNQV